MAEVLAPGLRDREQLHEPARWQPFPDLTRLVSPRSALVVGASQKPDSAGARLIANLDRSESVRDVVVVHPTMESRGKFRCFAAFEHVPEAEIDVALVLVKAAQVPSALRHCAALAIPFAIVMSSGFEEAGAEGRGLADEILAICRSTGLRVYGPNCPGLTNYRDRIALTFAPPVAFEESGAVGLVSQGGGSGRAVLQGLQGRARVGLSLTGGNELDLSSADFIAHMARDETVRVIVAVIEGIKDGGKLVKSLEEANRRGKPVVILKVGRTETGLRAAASHTGALAASADIVSAAFNQFGAIEVADLDELVAVTRLLAEGRRAMSRALAIVTFSGGAGAMAADHAELNGLQLARLGPSTTARLREWLPPFAASGNPVDVTAEALTDMDAMSATLRAVANDAAVGVVVVPIPADYGPATETLARSIVDVAKQSGAPIVPVWMSERRGPGYTVLDSAGLVVFPSVSKAMAAVGKSAKGRPTPQAATERIHHAPSSTIACTEAEAKQVLRRASISVPTGRLARDAAEATAIATEIGFPVVMKIASADIQHKTEVQGVRLDVRSAEQACATFEDLVSTVSTKRPGAVIDGVLVERMLGVGREMLVGIHRDPTFGSVVTVGLGGVLVEIAKDVTHRILPIGIDDALAMVGELKCGSYLGAFRGSPPADVHALAELVVKLSTLVSSDPSLEEVELNPVWVGPVGSGAIPLDALITRKVAEERQ